METAKEIRIAELRAAQDPETNEMIVEGRAIVYDSPTVMYEIEGIKYFEVIQKGALTGADLSDVAFKYNHSDNFMVMARTRNKTLELIHDEFGLQIRAKLADITAARDLHQLIKRGDIDKMSFSFIVLEQSYNRDTRTRVITKFKKILDVSAVDTPAYSDTSISARSFFTLEREKEQKALEREELRKRLRVQVQI